MLFFLKAISCNYCQDQCVFLSKELILKLHMISMEDRIKQLLEEVNAFAVNSKKDLDAFRLKYISKKVLSVSFLRNFVKFPLIKRGRLEKY